MSKPVISTTHGLGVVRSTVPCGGPGIKLTQVVGGAPVGRAVETAKMAAQHKRKASIVTELLIFFAGQVKL